MENKSQATNLEDKIESTQIDNDEDKLNENDNSQEQENIIIEDEIKKPKSKNEQAKELMQNSLELISKAKKEIEEAKKSVVKDVNRFEELKNNLLNTTFTQSQILLEKASYDYKQVDVDEPFELSLETPKEDVKVQNISSGGFTGFILAILAMLATACGWIFLASKQLGITLPQPPAIPDEETINKILTWIGGGLTGAEGNAMFGIATVAVSSLIVGVLVYKVRVALKEHKNFKIANEVYEKSHHYVEKQKESKTEMQKIDEYIKKVIPLLEDYKILLDEQNAKIQRILHIEGELDDYNLYHPSSIKEMQDSDRLMERIEELITIPVTKDGKLNENYVEAYNKAKQTYDYFISKLYS